MPVPLLCEIRLLTNAESQTPGWFSETLPGSYHPSYLSLRGWAHLLPSDAAWGSFSQRINCLAFQRGHQLTRDVAFLWATWASVQPPGSAESTTLLCTLELGHWLPALLLGAAPSLALPLSTGWYHPPWGQAHLIHQCN